MDVSIHYCEICKLRKPAEQIAAAIAAEFGITPTLHSARWGTFRVEYNGETIFDRWTDRGLIGRIGLGHKPNPEEVVTKLRPLLKQGESTCNESNDCQTMVETHEY